MGHYAVERIEDGFWRIEDGHVRCFVIEGSTGAALIDTGFGTADLPGVVAGITGKPLTLVNTHADGDHIGANERFGPAHMHPAEFSLYHSVQAGGSVAALWEGDAVDLGGRRLEVIHIPGHTPGSIALLEPERRFLIGGDSIQPGPIYMFGAARNMPAYIESMRKLEALSARFDRIYASHGTPELSPGLIPTLYKAARAVMMGEVEGVDPEPTHRLYGRCRQYSAFGVSFWYADGR